MSRWFRFYDGAIHDTKILRLSDASFRAWVTLLCIASKNNGLLPAAADIAVELRCKPALVASWIAELAAAGLLDKTSDGFTPHNWSERQYKSDSSAERMKRHRDKKRDVTPPVTSDVTVTVQNRTEADTEQNRADTRDDLQKREGDFCQAIVRTYGECNSPTLPDTSRAKLWLSQGYDPEICLAVIAQIVPKKPNVGLSYFDQPIAEAHAKKAPARKFVNGPPPIDWDMAVKSWKMFSKWPKDAGNDPSSPACRAPPEILRKYGFEPVIPALRAM